VLAALTTALDACVVELAVTEDATLLMMEEEAAEDDLELEAKLTRDDATREAVMLEVADDD
jgi:hypothetical protein